LRHSNGLAWQARASRVWASGTDAPHGVRTLGRRTLVPVMRNGLLRNLQIIEPDGNTRFLTPGKTRGCFHIIGRPAALILAAAEYDVAAGLHEATGHACAVCFDRENVPHVIRKLWCEFAAPVIAVTPKFDDHIESVARAFGGFSTAGVELCPWIERRGR
jgi:phage/plasmid primase-like uncharacterized protein